MPDPVYALTLELVVGSMTQVTTACLRASWGRAIADIFSPLRADDASFELANDVGSLSPLLNANLKPGRLVKLTATHGGSERALFSGRVKEFATRPAPQEKTTVINAVTELDRMSRAQLNTGMLSMIRTNSLYTEVMTRTSVQSFTADILGDDTVDFAWYRNRNSANAIEELIRSGYYQAYMDGAGTFQLRGRYFGVGVSAVGSHDEFFDLNYRLSDQTVMNRVKTSATPRAQSSNVSTLAFLAQPLTIPTSAHVGFFISFTDPRDGISATPVGSIETQVASTDYYAAANSDGTGTNYTSNLSLNIATFGETAVCSIFNSAAVDVYLSRFQFRGYPILRASDLEYQTDDSSSQNVYGLSELFLDNILLTNYPYLRGLAKLLLGERKNPRDALTAVLVNEFPQILDYEVGQQLALINSLSGVNSMWTVREVQHDLSLSAGLEHRVSYELEFFNERQWLILDHLTYGKLDSGRQLGL